jgi:class 3 adenylate cyclase/pimeloyl-ACP methyl ester carboxylesterase
MPAGNAVIEPEIAYARSRGLNVAYAVVGDAPLDVVFVPGFVSHLEASLEFAPIQRAIRRLNRFARVISFDKPGTGLSDPVEGAPTLEERMEDLTAVLDAVGVERAALFGASEGAPMSALFAATHVDRVTSLVMYGSYARGSWAEDYPWAPTPEQVSAGVALIEEGWGQGLWLGAFAPSFAADPRLVRWWARYERQAASPAMAKAISRLATEVDIREVLPVISVPTLVLHRTGDVSWPVGGARFIAERISGAKLVELEGIDHFPFAGDVDALIDEVEEFLTGVRPAREADRRLLTVLFTDIVGSTPRAAELGDRRWRQLLERHDELVGAEIERHRGRVVKTIGDGFLATFEGPARAIECARAAVAAISPIGIEIRVGLHTGECELIGDDIGGMCVHLAARVCEMASPGEVLVSRTVKDLVVGSGIAFAEHGVRELKGVPGEWELFSVAGSVPLSSPA